MTTYVPGVAMPRTVPIVITAWLLMIAVSTVAFSEVVASTNTRITWCYVSTTPVFQYRLWGHRQFPLPDVDLGTYQSVPELMDVAVRLGCARPVSQVQP